MSNEEMQKTIEFILVHQAQFVTRMEKDEVRLTRLEDAFATLVNIARITDEPTRYNRVANGDSNRENGDAS